MVVVGGLAASTAFPIISCGCAAAVIATGPAGAFACGVALVTGVVVVGAGLGLAYLGATSDFGHQGDAHHPMRLLGDQASARGKE
jgi:hypothetical protein